MSADQLKAFLEAVKADVGLQKQLKAANDTEVIMAIARTAGFAITLHDLRVAKTDIPEEQLEQIGGAMFGATSTSAFDCPLVANPPQVNPEIVAALRQQMGS